MMSKKRSAEKTVRDIRRATSVTADANPRINAAVFSWGSNDFPQPWLF